MERYLRETPMLDFSAPSIRALIRERGWDAPGRGYACAAADGSFEKIRSIYDFVRDEILFGYNTDDSIPASKVLRDGYGQCNTKGTLFMALLRKVILLVPFAILFPMVTGNVLSIYYAECTADAIAAVTCGTVFALNIRKILARGPQH